MESLGKKYSFLLSAKKKSNGKSAALLLCFCPDYISFLVSFLFCANRLTLVRRCFGTNKTVINV